MIVDMSHGKLDLFREKEYSEILLFKGLATDLWPQPEKNEAENSKCSSVIGREKNGYTTVKGFCLECQRKLITEIEVSAYCVT